jgi:hypothetical protein
LEKEDFFAAAALALGPLPVDHSGISSGTMVGGKVAKPAEPRPIQLYTYRLRLINLWHELGRPCEDEFNRQLFLTALFVAKERTIVDVIYEGYETWYSKQEKIRLAAEAI